MSQKDYKIGGIVSSNEVPNWARREPKWNELLNSVLELKPGQTLRVFFKDKATANRARNTIRDRINLEESKASIRTRVVEENEEQTVAYFTRLHDEAIRTEQRVPPESTKRD